MKPRRRMEGLVVKELADEVLVYDLERHRAHCLNPAAALVFKRCDGRTSVGELARMLRRELGAPADEKWVLLAVDRLERARLLEVSADTGRSRARMSRRELVRRVGLVSAALLPLVTSLVPPTPAQSAATCVTDCTAQPAGTPCGLTAWASTTGLGTASDCRHSRPRTTLESARL